VNADIQRALFSALNGNIDGDVVDRAPQNKARPYTLIGDIDLQSSDTDDSDGFEAVCTLETWTSYAGRAQGKAIADQIRGLLHFGDLDVDGFIGCAHESTDSTDSDDGVVVQSEFRIFLQP
jgi:hypothetical protein